MQKLFIPRNLVLLSLAFGLVLLYVAVGGGNFALDDGWIHQTYARNLAQNSEWAFIPGEPSAASTSPLYTLLLSVGYRLNIHFQLWTHSLGALALAFTAILGAYLAETLHPNAKRLPLLVGLALLLTWHHLWAAASGMETLLFGMLTLLLILLVWQQPFLNAETPALRPIIWHGVIFGSAAAITTLARPEGIVLAGIGGGLLLLVCLPRQGRYFLLWAGCAAAGFFIVISPYLLLNWQLTGGLLPDTAAAKFEQHAILLTLPYPVRVWQLFLAIITGGQALLLPGVVYFIIANRKRIGISTVEERYIAPLQGYALSLLPLFWALALILLYAARLPASYQHGRYVIPALPALVVMGVVGTWGLLQKTQQRKNVVRRVLGRTWAISLTCVYLIFALIIGVQVYSTDVAIIDGEMVAAAHYIRDNLSPDDLLAIHDIGAVGYFAPRPMIDIAGLITPELVPFLARPEALWGYLLANDARYLLAFPNQIPGRNPNDPRLCPVYTTNAAITQQVGEPNMTLYALVWNEKCED